MTARVRPAAVLPALAACLLAAPAAAQLGRTHPGPGYFTARDELHAGYLRRAERGMRNELRTAVKTIDSRWVDSILYSAGLGEALYQQGRLAESLAQFDAAIDLFLQQSDWLRSLEFQQDPREDTAIPRRLPTWARPARATAYADMPRSFLYAFGQVNNSQAYQQGGVVRQAQFWKLDAEELARAIAWTIYRRGDLLGPLGAYDARTKAVADRIAGGGLGPAGHWSAAWTELWWGLAEASRGAAIEARPHLERALQLGGRYDHRLAGLAWLAKGQLALDAGDATAARAFQEAVHAAIAYEDIDVLVAALPGWMAVDVIALDPKAPRPPLAAIADWSQRQGYWLASTQANLLLAESAALAGDAGPVRSAFRRGRDLTDGLLGREGDRLLALAAATSAPRREAIGLARQAVSRQATMSRRRLQVALASAWFDDGSLTPRLARRAFADVLGDPSLLAWVTAPLDATAAVAAPATDAFDRWFAATEERREALDALRIIDLQRRREFFSARPLAGREVAVRWLFEASDAPLSPDAVAARTRVTQSAPEYRNLLRDGEAARSALQAALDASPDSLTPAIKKSAEALTASLADREAIALRTALSRAPTPLVFPPPLDPVAAKGRLVAGEALLAFHEAGGQLYGVVLTAGGEHLWRIGPADRVGEQVERLLRQTVGTSPKQTWTAEDLTSTDWESAAAELAETLLADSRLDGAALTRLWIVPDGALWRAPLALLPVPSEREVPIRLGDLPMSLAPTPGWALRPRPEPAPDHAPGRSWAVASDPASQPDWEGIDPLRAVAEVDAPPVGLELSAELVKSAADAAVVDAGGQSPAANPLGLSLLPGERGDGTVAAWSGLPAGGTRAVALVGLGGGEAGGANVRRSNAVPTAGAAELHLTCSLLAGGVETALVERWPTRGARSRELVAEWLNGLGRLSPVEAWRRSRQLAVAAPLDPPREPRLGATPGETPSADHPFWWAAFYVID